jgi:hypothetical protein
MMMKLVVVFVLIVGLHTGYWLHKRDGLRRQWHAGQLTVGEFLAGMRGAPPWIDQGSAYPWEHMPRPK